MAETCSECGEEIRIAVNRVTDLSKPKKRYGVATKEFSVGVVAECGCESEEPKATELDSIRFHGEPPEGWL